MNPVEVLQALEQKILDRRSVLAENIKKLGQRTLLEYAQAYVEVNLNPPIEARQTELITVIQQHAQRLFGSTIAAEAAAQLHRYYFVSTADHHGPLCHQFFLNANTVTALPFANATDPLLKHVIVLSFSNVSFSNSSFPRGLFFHTYQNHEARSHRLPLIPSSANQRAVYGYPAYQQKALDNLQRLIKSLPIHAQHRQTLLELLASIYGSDNVLQLATYADQVSVTNRLLWQRVYGTTEHHLPDVLYIEIESLVSDILLRHHLEADTIINHLLFDPACEAYIMEYFDGIMGAFTTARNEGTYFFWGLPPGSKYRVQLWKRGNQLVSNDGQYHIELTPAAIADALRQQTLMPNMLLCFLVLSLYYGLKCLGGFNQINYLTKMKNAYIKMSVDRGNYRSIEVCARAQTKEMNDGLTLAFMGLPDGKRMLASSLDLILYGQSNWDAIMAEAKTMTFHEAIQPLLPDLYTVVYGEAERDPALTAFTDEQIISLIQLDKKIKPCGIMSGISDSN